MSEPTSAPSNSEPTATPPANPEFPNNFAKEVGADWDKAQALRYESLNYIKRLEAELAAAKENRVDPSAVAAARQSNIEALASELAVDPRRLAEAVAEVADYIADQKVNKFERAMTAHASVAGKIPDYAAKQAEVLNFLERPENAAIKREVADLNAAGFAESALRLAVREWQAAQPKEVPPTNPLDRAGAGLPPTDGAVARTPGTPAADSAARFKDVLDYTHRTHDLRPAFLELFGAPKQ